MRPTDRQRRDALLWNFTVLGEAATQLDGEVKARFAEILRGHHETGHGGGAYDRSG